MQDLKESRIAAIDAGQLPQPEAGPPTLQVPVPVLDALLRRFRAGAVAVSVAMLSLVGLALYLDRLEYLENAGRLTQRLVLTLSVSVGGVLEKMEVVLSEVADQVERDLERGAVDGAALNRALLRRKPLVLEFEDMWVADEQGNVRWGTNIPLHAVVNIRDRDYFQQAMRPESRLVISKPLLGRVTKAPAMIVAKRISRPDGSFGGIALGSIRVSDYFRAMFAPVDLGPRSVITVRGADMANFYRWANGAQDDAQIGDTNISAGGRQALTANPVFGTYVATSTNDGVERTFSYHQVASYPLYLFVGQDTTASLAPWRREVLASLGVLAFLVVAVALYTRAACRAARECLDAAPSTP